MARALVQRMCGWLGLVRPARQPAAAVSHRSPLEHGGSGETRGSKVVQFPIRGDALLVELASQLRARVRDRAPPHPLILTIRRAPHLQLVIDASAYAEFDRTQLLYRAAIRAAEDTNLTLETRDFDTLVEFVVQYVADRLADASPLGAAS